MSSFFTAPKGQKKRKRPTGPEVPKKRAVKSAGAPKKRVERDESISGSDSDFESEDGRADGEAPVASDASDNEGETAAERRLRLAERYLDNVRQEVDEVGFDAEEIDRDLIAERLQEDVAESKGKVYRHLVGQLDLEKATHTLFRWNSDTVTSVALCAPYAYTTSREGLLVKWRLQDLPKDQYPQTTKKKPKKPPAPPRRRPERIASSRADSRKTKDKTYQGHTGPILTVAASEDGKYVVTGGTDRRLVVHDASTLRPIRAFAHHRDWVTGAVFRRGSNQLFSCSKDRTVKVWSMDELAFVETLYGHADDVADVDALSRDRCVSVGARDRTARLWKVVEETQLVFRGGQGEKKKPAADAAAGAPPPPHPLSLAREGSMDRVAMIDDDLFVTGSDNGALALWTLQKKKPLFVLPRAHGIDAPLRPDQASAEARPPPDAVPPPQPRWITALRTVPYSDLILSGSWDGCVRAWRLSEDKRRIEPAGVLGAEGAAGEGPGAPGAGAGAGAGLVRGVVNDISIAERGDRGRDGLCVVVAVGKEHRLGRWGVVEGGRNGAMVFEVPRATRPEAKSAAESSGDEEEP